MASGARVLGRRAVLAQSWKDCATSFEPRRERRPRFAGARDVRVPALASYRSFLSAYMEARDRWKRGLEALFPAGTYWLTRFAHVQVAPPCIRTSRLRTAADSRAAAAAHSGNAILVGAVSVGANGVSSPRGCPGHSIFKRTTVW